MSAAPVKLIGISGSLREGSYNTLLLRSLEEFMPADVKFEVIETLSLLPFYNPDLEADLPEVARNLRDEVRDADGLIIASPEYNYSFTAVLKNAIEWLTRPPADSALEAKPVALVGAAPGLYGTVRGQGQLRQVLHGANALVISRPEVYVNEVAKKFDGHGTLTDPIARELSGALVTNLLTTIHKLRRDQ
jgi:chromate reductase